MAVNGIPALLGSCVLSNKESAMTTQRHQATAHIKNTPEVVLGFIADVRNRTQYLPSLKSLTDIQGGPAGAGTTWKWKFAILGTDFEGAARSLKYEPGKLYSFQTEGGLQSAWTYHVEPEGDGTKLTIDVEYTIPDQLVARLPSPQMLETMKKDEGDRAINNLRTLLEK
jgi:carbon monoxide dehydrogenase subunit G